MPHEIAKINTRRHWMILMPIVLKPLAIVAVAVFFLSNDPDSMALDNVVLLVIVAVAGYLAYQLVQWRLDHFVVTDRRVLLVSGVLTKRAAVMPLIKVTDLTYEQNPVARGLDYGTFVFESAGQDQALSRVTHLPGAHQIYLTISGLIFAATYADNSMYPSYPSSEQMTKDVRTDRAPGAGEPHRQQTAPIQTSDPNQGRHGASPAANE